MHTGSHLDTESSYDTHTYPRHIDTDTQQAVHGTWVSATYPRVLVPGILYLVHTYHMLFRLMPPDYYEKSSAGHRLAQSARMYRTQRLYSYWYKEASNLERRYQVLGTQRRDRPNMTKCGRM